MNGGSPVGVTLFFGRKLPVLLARSGLEKIRHEATAEVVSGSSVWARWWQQTLEAIREWEQAHDDMTEMRDRDYTPLIAFSVMPRAGFSMHSCIPAPANVQHTSETAFESR